MVIMNVENGIVRLEGYCISTIKTVNNIVSKWKQEGHCRVKNIGRPKQVSERMRRAVKRNVQKNRRSITEEVAEASGLSKYAVKILLKNVVIQKR